MKLLLDNFLFHNQEVINFINKINNKSYKILNS